MADKLYAVDQTRNNAQLDLFHHVQKFGNATTLHGIQYVTGEKIHFIRRTVWVIILLVSLSWSASCTYQYIRRFQKFDIATKVTIEYNKSMAFPALTFCNLNQWRRSVLTDSAKDLASRMYSLQQDVRDEFNWTAYYEDIGISRKIFTLNMTEVALSASGAYTAAEMIKKCAWNGVEYCGHENFTTLITDLGVCYTFNNPSNLEDVLVVNKPGIDNGLTLTLDIKQDDYIPGEFQGAGIKSKSEPHPYSSNCTHDELKYSSVYTVPLCLHECKVDYVTKLCGCRDYRYPKDPSITECGPEEMFNCTIPQEKLFTKKNIHCQCNMPCSSGTYEGRLSVSYWPGLPVSSELTEIYPEYPNRTSQRENLLRMKLYYEELSYTSVNQYPAYSLPSLASDIGGTLGLLCGMSLITVIEFLDFFSHLFYKYFLAIGKRNSTHDIPV